MIDISLKEPPAGTAACRLWQPLGPTVFWAFATLAGIFYVLAVLCLCAYAPLHFTVMLAQRTSMVRDFEANQGSLRKPRVFKQILVKCCPICNCHAVLVRVQG